MMKLVAQGPLPEQSWRRVLPVDREFTLGRAAPPWSLAWDMHVSRQHVALRFDGQRLRVWTLPEARNPVFFRGRIAQEFWMRPGESFMLGSTRVALEDTQLTIERNSARPAFQTSFDSHSLRQRAFLSDDERWDVLTRLPEVLAEADSDEDWATQLVSLVLAGVPRADFAALIESVECGDEEDSRHGELAQQGGSEWVVRHWDRRGPTSSEPWGPVLAPRESLIREVLNGNRTVWQSWNGAAGNETDEKGTTGRGGVEWALASPLRGGGDARGRVLYVAGRAAVEPPSSSQMDDAKFTELVAATAGRLRETRRLVRRQTALRGFFSPLVLEALGQRDPDEVLSPREVDASVLFCDLRGFSRASEALSRELLKLLERVSEALGLMTHHILAEGGVIGDFHGDAAMGFWGWPIAQSDAAERACRAALAIHESFRSLSRATGHVLAGFRVGVGVASGRAVAGRIGSVDQVKVTAFGPVVNRAARLESMTKELEMPILLDGPTAQAVAVSLPTDLAVARRVASITPSGFPSPVDVWQLVAWRDVPAGRDPGEWSSASAEVASAFARGAWGEALRDASRLPVDDALARWVTRYARRHGTQPPPGWSGSVVWDEK